MNLKRAKESHNFLQQFLNVSEYRRSQSALCPRKSVLGKVYRFHLNSSVASAASLEMPVLNAWDENDYKVYKGKKTGH